MSIVNGVFEKGGQVLKKADYLKIDPKKDAPSNYISNDKEKIAIALVRYCYYQGYTTMYTPRIEFNDLSTYHRYVYDQFLWNTYQPNNGQPASEDKINGWRSNAMRPVVRNKAISIAAHASARLLFPKVFAYNQSSELHQDSAKVMSHLMEWAGQQGGYAMASLHAIIAALASPASILFSEYAQVTRTVKDERGDDGEWSTKDIEDAQFSGFQFENVPVDEFYISNFYEPNMQKQDWVIWRKVISYDTASIKYANASMYPNFQYVQPGMQTIMDEINKGYYNKYDNHMRRDEVEELIYWNRAKDLKLVLVNGVLLTPYDNANPRNDKMFPFAKFGYGIINSRSFYYKSLSFSLQQDTTIVNTLYRMIIDGTYLSIMPPMVNTGSEKIGANVIVPGLTTNLTDKDAKLDPIRTTTEASLKAGLDVLDTVGASLSESSQDPIQQGQNPATTSTAYQISRIEQNAATVLGFFVKMIVSYVQQTGNLMKGDILQYLTIADAAKIDGDSPLVYKTFVVNTSKKGKGPSNTRMALDGGMKDQMTDKEQEDLSWKILIAQGGLKSDTKLYKVNPSMFRDMDYQVFVDADTLTPRSEELERAFHLETFDRAINSPVADQEKIYTDLLMASDPLTARDPDKYLMKKAPPQPQNPNDPNANNAQPQTMRTPAAPKSPVGNLPQGALAGVQQ